MKQPGPSLAESAPEAICAAGHGSKVPPRFGPGANASITFRQAEEGARVAKARALGLLVGDRSMREG
jgi:hypothetical protein